MATGVICSTCFLFVSLTYGLGAARDVPIRPRIVCSDKNTAKHTETTVIKKEIETLGGLVGPFKGR